MLRRLLFAVIFAAPAVSFAQQPGRPTTQPVMTQPSAPAVVIVPSTPSVYIVGGPYGTYLIPLSTLPRQEVGISLAGREGISLEAPLQTGVSTAVPSPYNFGAPIAYPGVLAGNAGTPVGEAQTGRLINDFGPSFYAGETASIVTAPSLGEYARAYKQSHRRAVRIFTNTDAERLSSPVGVPGATAPNPEPKPPAVPPQKENLQENRKPQIPRATASVITPVEDAPQP